MDLFYTGIEVSNLLPAGMPAVFDDKGFTIGRIIRWAPAGGSASSDVVRSVPGNAALIRTKCTISDRGRRCARTNPNHKGILYAR
jgi:hypothetical protein